MGHGLTDLVFGLYWAVLGLSSGSLGPPWGRPGIVLGRLLATLDPVLVFLGRLGAVLSRLGSLKARRGGVSYPSWSSFGRPKGSQDEAKIGPKRDQNGCQKRRRKKKVLKIVLEPSWADFRSFWGSSWGRRMGFRLGETAFRENSRFFLFTIRCQKATLSRS